NIVCNDRPAEVAEGYGGDGRRLLHSWCCASQEIAEHLSAMGKMSQLRRPVPAELSDQTSVRQPAQRFRLIFDEAGADVATIVDCKSHHPVERALRCRA